MRGRAFSPGDRGGKDPLPGGLEEGLRMQRVQRSRWRRHYQAAGDNGEVRENPRMNAAEHDCREFHYCMERY